MGNPQRLPAVRPPVTMRYILIDQAIAAVRSLAAGVLADSGSQPSEQDLARLVRKIFKDAHLVPAEDMTEVARWARDRAREGNGSKDRDVADIADSILTMLALSKIPDTALLVLGREGEVLLEVEGLDPDGETIRFSANVPADLRGELVFTLVAGFIAQSGTVPGDCTYRVTLDGQALNDVPPIEQLRVELGFVQPSEER